MNKVRKIFFLIIIALFLIVGFLILNSESRQKTYDNKRPTPQQKPVTVPSTQTYEKPTDSVPSEGGLAFNWIIVRDPKKVSLHSNLLEKLSSFEAKKKNSCLHLINAGFYTKEDKHVGLFISAGEKLSESKESQLFNGYFSIASDDKPSITWFPSAARLALQSGPILMEKKQPAVLKLEDDNPARRIVLAITQEDNLVFLVIYNKKSVFDGPLLSQVPGLLKNLNQDTSLEIVDALNLDGGSASAFISESVNLSELTRIGSYFCVKEGLIIY